MVKPLQMTVKFGGSYTGAPSTESLESLNGEANSRMVVGTHHFARRPAIGARIT